MMENQKEPELEFSQVLKNMQNGNLINLMAASSVNILMASLIIGVKARIMKLKDLELGAILGETGTLGNSRMAEGTVMEYHTNSQINEQFISENGKSKREMEKDVKSWKTEKYISENGAMTYNLERQSCTRIEDK